MHEIDAAGVFDALDQQTEVLCQLLNRPHLIPEPDFVDLVHVAVAACQVALDDLDARDGARQLVAELLQWQQLTIRDDLAGSAKAMRPSSSSVRAADRSAAASWARLPARTAAARANRTGMTGWSEYSIRARPG
jgi:hypothetical protein